MRTKPEQHKACGREEKTILSTLAGIILNTTLDGILEPINFAIGLYSLLGGHQTSKKLCEIEALTNNIYDSVYNLHVTNQAHNLLVQYAVMKKLGETENYRNYINQLEEISANINKKATTDKLPKYSLNTEAITHFKFLLRILENNETDLFPHDVSTHQTEKPHITKEILVEETDPIILIGENNQISYVGCIPKLLKSYTNKLTFTKYSKTLYKPRHVKCIKRHYSSFGFTGEANDIESSYCFRTPTQNTLNNPSSQNKNDSEKDKNGTIAALEKAIHALKLSREQSTICPQFEYTPLDKKDKQTTNGDIIKTKSIQPKIHRTNKKFDRTNDDNNMENYSIHTSYYSREKISMLQKLCAALNIILVARSRYKQYSRLLSDNNVELTRFRGLKID